MNEAEHRKQMLIQQIADHRELMRREMEILQESNPVKPVIESGRRLLGIFGAIRLGRDSTGDRSIESRRAQLDVELVRTTLPVLVQVMRAVLERRQERRARKRATE